MPSADHEIVTVVRRITERLDYASRPELRGLPEVLCRALKVQEETGELAEAIVGALGHNPRKGVTNDWSAVVCEAMDVVVTALVFAQSVFAARHPELADTDLGQLFNERVALLAARAELFEPEPAEEAPRG